MDWMNYFEMMKDWKLLPAYRTEPRIDSIIGYYLPKFAGEFLGDEIKGIIPELPIRLASVKPKHEGTNYADRSYKVDFYLLGYSGINYLVEFKTDLGSRKEEQDNYLLEAKSIGMRAIVNGILRIAEVSFFKDKYKHLLTKLINLGLLDNNERYLGKSSKIEIIYIQPNTKNKNEKYIDFVWISDWIDRNYPNCDFERYFGITLKNWAAT